MGNRARGYIPPELWDHGINAGLLNYNFTGNNVHNDVGGSSNYAYLNLQSGLNLAPGACATTPPGATAAAAVRRPMKTSGSTSIPGLSVILRCCARA
jgi:hypothetical protein